MIKNDKKKKLGTCFILIEINLCVQNYHSHSNIAD